MSQPTPSLLPGQSPPVTIITATDRSGLVLIIASLGLIFALISILIRLYVRYEFSPRRFAYDDAVIGVAMIFLVFQSAAVFVGVSKGFGKSIESISPLHLVELQKASYASDILYIATLWLTKFSVAFLFLRLTPNRRHVMASKAIMVVTGVMAFISMMILALRCDLSHPWIEIDVKCTGLFVRWQVIVAFDTITEIALFAMSIYVIWGLQMSLQKKAVVVMAFSFRLPLIIAAAFRLHYLSNQIHSDNPTLFGVYASICTQVELFYAIIAATIPCLRPFMTATSTHYGAPPSAKVTARASGANSSSQSGKVPSSGKQLSLASISSYLKTSSSGRFGKNSEKLPSSSPSIMLQQSHTSNAPNQIYGNDDQNHEAVVTPNYRATGGIDHPRPRQDSMESSESKQMFIRKSVDFTVTYDDGSNTGRAL